MLRDKTKIAALELREIFDEVDKELSTFEDYRNGQRICQSSEYSVIGMRRKFYFVKPGDHNDSDQVGSNNLSIDDGRISLARRSWRKIRSLRHKRTHTPL